MKTIALLAVVLLVGGAGAALPAQAQTPVPPPAPAIGVSRAELERWLGPIALYPDPLLAQVLAATARPSEIVLGDRYLSRGGDPGLIDDQPWDLSVKALARYPGVLQMMNDYFEWTTALGAAFVYQQQEVMDEIQRLRAAALDLGNLQSTLQQNVIVEDGFIEILPAEADVIYVPQYPPDIVYTQGSVGAPWILFGAGYAMGAWMDRDFDWPRRRLLIWDHIYSRPADWWSSRRPTPPDREGPENPSGNPRTQPIHFLILQVPQVSVVTSGGPGVRGLEAGRVSWGACHRREGYSADCPRRR